MIELEDQMAIFARAQALAHLGHWVMRVDEDAVTWSDELYRIMGVPIGTPMTRHDFRERVWEEDRAHQAAAIGRAIAEGGEFEFTIRVRRPSGETRVLKNTGEVRPDPRGGVARLVGVCLDVTESHAHAEQLAQQAEELHSQTEELTSQTEELQSQAEELAALNALLIRQRRFLDVALDHVPGALGYCGRDLVLRVANAAYAARLGATPEAIVGKHVSELMPEHWEAVRALATQVLETGEPWEVRSLPLTEDGQEVYRDAMITPVHGPDGAIEGLLSLSTDVSARVVHERLANEQIAKLEAIDRYKDEFLGVLSHELRTPLNFIMGFASLLDDEVQGPLTPAQHESLGKILAGTERMLKLVEDLLDIAGIQAGKTRLDLEEADVGALAAEAVAALAPMAAGAGLTLRVLPPEAPLPARCDPSRVDQVISNLLANALKFTPRGGEVTATVAAVPGGVRVAVADTGPGIAADDLPRVFGKFEQLDMSVTREAGGIGLGLAIAQALIEAQGGAVGVESEPGKGSTFWFTLPSGTSA